jgi:hypothetical protein
MKSAHIKQTIVEQAKAFLATLPTKAPQRQSLGARKPIR